MSPNVALSQAVVQVAGVLAAALAVKMYTEREEASMLTSSRPCPTCNGTRRVPCFCNRWSDGDVGCNTCGGTGRMQCSSCGGTGTGRPLPARVTVQERQS
eukprot:TRINITY_DN473_c0_g1_i4.p1 TRINITY_DN473_c0_g1~~TRINITY_DN473_c0_g1_i4.p1  ORF type:complete len:100 (+),score=14.17 TRINITY_DN473_c0_g1_i4:318-617(+)